MIDYVQQLKSEIQELKYRNNILERRKSIISEKRNIEWEDGELPNGYSCEYDDKVGDIIAVVEHNELCS